MKSINNTYKFKLLAWLAASLFAVLFAGCGGGSSSGAGATGTLGVSLTDAPACGFDAVNVTVNKIRVHQSSSATETDAGWTDITLNPARKIDLLSLNNGTLTSLGETPLATGHYTQLRLVLDPNTANGLANSVVPTGGVETPLITPSAVQSGIKLVNQFDVVSGQRVDLLLDFNACKSIVKRGNGAYALKPVVKVIPYVLNGIEGFVDPTLLGSNVIVTAQQNGTIVQTTAPSTATGKFFLARVATGNYDVAITADNHAAAVITSVPVVSTTSVTTISTNTSPIALLTSNTHSVSGTEVLLPTSSATVSYVTAKQTFGTTPTLTLKEVAADDLSGAYTLILPTAAPLLGQYSATLPIVFTAQTSMAGKYNIEASATGYATQSVATDISLANVTQNFTLVP